MAQYLNPVLKGYNADPSVCRVGEDYYLVTSTGEYFPGVPIYHSRDLVHWQMLGHCLSRASQLNLDRSNGTGGIYAPTLRYSDGTFYLICTNTTNNGNFVIHAPAPTGPWSDPKWIDEGGIDPSLFFDDDGKVYYCSTHRDPADGRQCTIAFEIDPISGKILSDRHIIGYGAGGKYPEGPHIYRIGAFYYLIQAEGGTEYGHMTTIFRSKHVYGPYESCPHNPILSHKDNQYSSIQCVGHGDLVDDVNGRWWILCHGIRMLDSRLLHNTGREVYLAPVVWNEAGWPVCGQNGRLDYRMEGPILGGEGDVAPSSVDFSDDFVQPEWPPQWTFVHNPDFSKYARADGLQIRGGSETLNDASPAFVGVRQPEHRVRVRTELSTALAEGQRAGLTAYYNRYNHYEACLIRENGRLYAALSKHLYDMETLSGKQEIPNDGWAELSFTADVEDYTFECRTSAGVFRLGTAKTAGLCTESQMLMCFSGTFNGLFSTGGSATFRNFEIRSLESPEQ